MCEICKIKKGDCAFLISDCVEVKIGGRELTEHLLGLYIHHKGDDTYDLEAAYFLDGGDAVSRVKMPIKYCPFCGRELPHKPEKKYPWDK